MEFVDGKPITEHCERAGLSIEKRLELFEAVCEAVQHAHRSLVVHRDLKPGNILVREDRTVKLLDFGIAKLLNPAAFGEGDAGAAPATRTGLWLLTPEYAAPEQVRSQSITTATDVFALGAVLFELVTNVRPRELHGRSPTEVVDAVGNGELPAASSAASAARARRLKGDIDTIIAKATRQQPQERYASARDLAEDLRRHREGLPIVARSASIAYRGRRFVRRHRIAVLAALAALVFGAYHVTQLTRERNRARVEAATAARVLDFLVDLFAESDPERSRGDTVTAREILSRGAAKIDEGLTDEPLVRARLLATLGSVHRELGLYKEALPLLESSLAIREKTLASDHLGVAQSLHSLGVLLSETGDRERARELFERGIHIPQSKLGPHHPDVAFSLSSVAQCRYAAGDREGSRALHERALAIWEETHGPNHPDAAMGANNLANLLADMGERGEARRLYDRATAIRERILGPDHPSVAVDLNNIGVLLWDSGDPAGAIPYHERALAIREKAFGPDHRHVAQSLDNLAIVLNATGDVARARALRAGARDPGDRARPRSPRRRLHGEQSRRSLEECERSRRGAAALRARARHLGEGVRSEEPLRRRRDAQPRLPPPRHGRLREGPAALRECAAYLRGRARTRGSVCRRESGAAREALEGGGGTRRGGGARSPREGDPRKVGPRGVHP